MNAILRAARAAPGLGALSLTVALALTGPVHADTLIDNVSGLTPDGKGGIESFRALQIGDDGRIVKVFQQSPDLQPLPEKRGRHRKKDRQPPKPAFAYRYDGKGRVLIPGFVDSHADVMGLGLALLKAKAGFKGTPAGEPRPEDRDLALAEAQDLFLKHGFTTVTDMGTTIANWQTYRRSGDRGALRLRIISYAAGVPDMLLIGGPGPGPWLYDDKLKFNGIDIDMKHMSVTNRDDGTQLRNLISRGAIDNFQVAITVHGAEQISAALAALEEIVLTYKGERRWRIEDADRIVPGDVARMKALGVFATVQPGMPVALAAEPAPSAASLAAPWRTMIDAGVPVSFASAPDDTVPNPFADMAAATRPGALTGQQALAAWTSDGAKAALAEDNLGRIAPGLRADFLLIDRNPLLTAPGEIGQTRILEVWIDGQLAWKPEQPPAPAPQQSPAPQPQGTSPILSR